jgi:rubrerythrin
MNLETAIKTAIVYETRIRDLYASAALEVGAATGRRLFTALKNDEQYHLDYLAQRLREWEQTGDVVYEVLKKTIPDAAAIKGNLKKLEKRVAENDRSDEKQMLSKALEVEVETSAFYGRMVDGLDGACRRMFARFLEIEDSHIAIVQAQLDYLAGTGYWFDLKEFDMEDF